MGGLMGFDPDAGMPAPPAPNGPIKRKKLEKTPDGRWIDRNRRQLAYAALVTGIEIGILFFALFIGAMAGSGPSRDFDESVFVTATAITWLVVNVAIGAVLAVRWAAKELDIDLG